MLHGLPFGRANSDRTSGTTAGISIHACGVRFAKDPFGAGLIATVRRENGATFRSGVRKVKFVLLTQCYPPEIGGAQVLLGSLATELKRQGHEVKVVTALPNYPTGKIFKDYRGRSVVREEIDGIPVFRTWIYAAQSARLFPRLMN